MNKLLAMRETVLSIDPTAARVVPVELNSMPNSPNPPSTSPPDVDPPDEEPPDDETESAGAVEDAIADAELFAREEALLWGTLSRRWPHLAAQLTRRPDHVEDILNATAPPDAPAELLPLFTDEDVLAVARGEAPMVGAFLTPNSIGRLTEA